VGVALAIIEPSGSTNESLATNQEKFHLTVAKSVHIVCDANLISTNLLPLFSF
jgi:hypothetical protein